eukprot:TRINITY_DN10243_c0_g1_i1.p1 TRINITY_DN10243_c0_g1~~TRINITY_DN10243_c0_g1_i1.p1  ORF type:complete len:602 (-),score=179.68 TRINITY_DN10243_c0_g1_i1:62-1813(-)
MKTYVFVVLLALTIAIEASPRQSISKYVEPTKAGKYIQDGRCILDPKINIDSITNETVRKDLHDWLWQTACPRARGVFTLLDEYAGETYSCANFPESWGISHPTEFFQDPAKYEEHLEYLSLYLEGVYNTTAVKGPQACDFAGLSVLYCGEDKQEPWKSAPWAEKVGNMPLRGVNAGGLFLLEPWITPGFVNWTLEMADQYTFCENFPAGSPEQKDLEDLWENWYTDKDFEFMVEAGLNAVRLPVGFWYWAQAAGLDHKPYTVPKQDILDKNHPITKFISMAKKAGLQIFLDLHGAPKSQNGLDNSGERSKDMNPERWGYDWWYDPQAIKDTTTVLVHMVKYIQHLESLGIDNVAAIELVNEPWVFGDMSVVRDFYRTTIEAIREISDIPIIMSDAFRHTEWVWLLNDWPYENTFLDTHIYHAFNPDDIASSNPSCDKLKQTVNENIACGYGSLMRYKTCFSLPSFMGEWSLAIDDCMGELRGARESVQFLDFGQCKNLEVRINDEWWIEHVNSFASRQMHASERELGWFFWTFKTGPGAKADPSNRYWSYVDAVDAGFIDFPITDDWVQDACLYNVEDAGKC